jgi:hypothetical protein
VPTDSLEVVAGDPLAVADAASVLISVSAEVERYAARLRALASPSGDWTGRAAVEASSRAATLPPKLEKVHVSYGAAGAAMQAYARALADAQERSRAAVVAAQRAEEELRTAQAAAAAAAARDAAAATAAGLAGQLPPPPTAPRYEAAVAEAAGALRRAAVANEQAHSDQQGAARAASAALNDASHQGIPNKSWWHHFDHAVASWATTQWRETLSSLSAAAGEISLVAGVAAAVLAVGGVFFPPLEVAAGVAESVALVSGVAANVGTAAVDLSQRRTLKDGMLSVAMLVMPRAASKLVPERLSGGAVLRVAEQGPPRTIPLGFDSEQDFKAMSNAIASDLRRRGYEDTVAVMQGSSVTGASHQRQVPFDVERRSDYDVALCSPTLFAAAVKAGVQVRGGGVRTMPLDAKAEPQLRALGLWTLREQLSQAAGREVNFMVYRGVSDALDRAPGIRFPPPD